MAERRRILSLKRLSKMFDDFFDEDENRKPENAGRHAAIRGLKNVFIDFATEYLDYFAQAPSEVQKKYLKQAINRIYDEWANISRACEQRLVQSDPVDAEDLAEQLAQADKTAKAYYSRFLGNKINSDAPAVYFEKNYHITRYPFTPYALVSIPIQDFDSKRWTGLAHELGHHIYWNSLELEDYRKVHDDLRIAVLTALKPVTSSKIQASSFFPAFYKRSLRANIWMNWLEEAFADVCGTLMAGDKYVQSDRDIANDEISSGIPLLVDKDEDHPTSFVRPLIAITTLGWLVENWTGANDEETQAGKAALQAKIDTETNYWMNHNPNNFDRSKVRTEDGLSLTDMEGSVKAVVYAILGANWKDSTGNNFGPFGKLFKCDTWINTLVADKDDELVPELENGTSQTVPPRPLTEHPTALERLIVVVKDIIQEQNDLLPTSDIADDKVLEVLSQYSLASEDGLCTTITKCTGH